jgi:aspartyl-tRNA(Asn)/glutamyl-tRNA(Gln) amidotransferase subunit A
VTNLHDLGIGELVMLLERRSVSPVELCQHLLARAGQLDRTVNAFISLDGDRVLAQAARVEREPRRGPLHGIPIAIKDNCLTRDEPTTAGSRVFTGAARDATVVQRLREGGAIIFGKTNLPELAYGPVDAYHYGPSRNPWDLTRSAGGSSMGSAAALAARIVPGAIGTDTSGSIRNPACWSGVVGLKPTYGRVPLGGVVRLARSLDHVGPMARSAADCALLLDAISHAATPELAGRPRVGVLRTLWDALAPDVGVALDAAVDELRALGASVGDVSIPSWDVAVDAGNRVLECEAAAEHGELAIAHGQELLGEIRERLEHGMRRPAVDYIGARRVGARLRRELRDVFTEVDVLVLPGRERTAPRVDADGRSLDPRPSLRCPLPLNVAGFPALAIPCGFDSNRLPIGMQLACGPGREALALAVAGAFEQVTDWHARRPPIAVGAAY